MVLVGGAYSVAKTNMYRSLVDQPLLAANTNPTQVAAAFCMNLVNIAPEHDQLDMGRDANFATPVPATGDNLATFLGNRLSMSFHEPGLPELRPDRPGERHARRQRRGHRSQLQHRPPAGHDPRAGRGQPGRRGSNGGRPRDTGTGMRSRTRQVSLTTDASARPAPGYIQARAGMPLRCNSAYDGDMTRPPGEAELRPVIVTVDDDPSVSRAVARDLRRRYGERNRIVRAESGEQALDALRQMKLRGDQVAVILADYRMPGLTGIEFLERAMDIYPFARRVLLTAYADTSAAIDAINIVDLDHYLLKPWDPPEEKLYPVIDDLLQGLAARGPQAGQGSQAGRAPLVRAVGGAARLPGPQPGALPLVRLGHRRRAAAARRGGRGRPRPPVLITADGEPLITPTHAEVAAKVGLATMPGRDFYDLVVVGGGPAGLGAAVYGASEGLRTVLVEKFATGGQAGQSSRIENYLGFPDGLSGGQLTDRARRQAVKFGAELLTTREVTGLEVNGPARTIRLSDGGAIDAKAVILATGVSYRQLNAPGCTEMTGAGVYYGAALTEAEGCKDQDVYVVGGANSAGQAAVYLAGSPGR